MGLRVLLPGGKERSNSVPYRITEQGHPIRDEKGQPLQMVDTPLGRVVDELSFRQLL
jgi:hypothetical protein